MDQTQTTDADILRQQYQNFLKQMRNAIQHVRKDIPPDKLTEEFIMGYSTAFVTVTPTVIELVARRIQVGILLLTLLGSRIEVIFTSGAFFYAPSVGLLGIMCVELFSNFSQRRSKKPWEKPGNCND